MVLGYADPAWDMHVQTAMDVFELPADKVDKLLHRLPSKTIGFGVAYRIGPDGLQSAIVEAYAVAGVYEIDGQPVFEAWTTDRCGLLIKKFYSTKPAIAEWQELQDYRVRRHGCVWTIFGRHRLIPQGKSTLSWVRSAGFREGANQPVQGSAQDILKLAMAEIEDRRESFNHKTTVAVRRAEKEIAHRDGELVRPLLQVHDELIFECKGEEVGRDWTLGVCKPIMEGQVPLKVPIKASAEMGERWGEMEEIAA
jgi:DNA polymerase-1